MNAESKKLKVVLKLLLEAGKASSSPALSSVLGNYKVSTSEFCKDFNNKTSWIRDGVPVVVFLFVFDNKSYEYVVKMPPSSFYLKLFSEIEVGSGSSSRDIVSSITPELIYELVCLKKKEYPFLTERSLFRTFVSTCHSIGIIVE
jgi:large subunit ribosomal protein L11